jgi:hypothetical protein
VPTKIYISPRVQNKYVPHTNNSRPPPPRDQQPPCGGTPQFENLWCMRKRFIQTHPVTFTEMRIQTVVYTGGCHPNTHKSICQFVYQLYKTCRLFYLFLFCTLLCTVYRLRPLGKCMVLYGSVLVSNWTSFIVF